MWNCQEFLELRRDVPEYREADGVPLSVHKFSNCWLTTKTAGAHNETSGSPEKQSAGKVKAVVPSLFGSRDSVSQRMIFHGPEAGGVGWGNSLGMIQVDIFIVCFYFYYYYIFVV